MATLIQPGVKLGRVSGFSKPGFRVFGFFKKKKKKWNLKKKKKKSKFLGGVGWEGGVGVGGAPPTPPSKEKNPPDPNKPPVRTGNYSYEEATGISGELRVQY